MPSPPQAAAQTNLPEPHQDRAAAGADAPSRTGRLLGLVRKLIDCGKELASTLQQRTAATNLATITRNFGTFDIASIVAHITRALHRAAALEIRLLSRVARGDDGPALASAPAHRHPRAAQPAAQRASGAESGLAHLPTPRDIAADVRRRPVGAVIADICRDLGIVPSDPLWRELSLAIIENGGNLVTLFVDASKRVARAVADPSFVAPPGVTPPGWPAPCLPSPAASGAGPP